MKKSVKIILIIVGVIVVLGIVGLLLSDDGAEYNDTDEWSDSLSGQDMGQASDSWDDSDSDWDGDDNYDTNQGGSGAYANGNDLGFGNLGSADKLAGNTLVISIFADDANTSWTEADSDLMGKSLDYTGIACDWLTSSAAKYGSSASFVYDWEQNGDLRYTASINVDLTGDSMDTPTWEYIDSNIDTAALKSKYNADNVIYLVMVNTPMDSSVTSCTRNYYEGMEYPYEMCFMYMGCDGYVEAPAAFAHEMLHTYGAPDLYSADEEGDNYGTTQELVDQYTNESSNDIMFTTFDAITQEPYYDHISNEFTEIDAYYVGITNSSETAEYWGLQSSQH